LRHVELVPDHFEETVPANKRHGRYGLADLKDKLEQFEGALLLKGLARSLQ